MNRELSRRLKDENLRKTVEVTQLTVLDIRDLERYKHRLEQGENTLHQFVNCRSIRDPTYRSDFGSVISDYLPAKHREAVQNECLNKVFERVNKLFFETGL